MLDGTTEVRAREGVVDDERNAQLATGVGQRTEVGDVESRIADRLDEPCLGRVVGRRDEARDVGRVDEPRGDPEALEGVQEDVPGPAVEGVRRDDRIARSGEVEDSKHLRRVARRGRDRIGTPVQCGDAVLEGGVGGVGEARVDVAEGAQPEEVGCLLGRLERIRDCLVDGEGPRTGGRVGRGAGVDRGGIEMEVALTHECLLVMSSSGRESHPTAAGCLEAPPELGARAEGPGLGHQHHRHHEDIGVRHVFESTSFLVS